MFIIFSVFYILIAAAMIVLILMQRGSGADAGSGFGGGSSATVFGARGSATFLTRATAVLAALFFLLSLGMGIYLSRTGAPGASSSSDLGVMAGAQPAPAPAVAASAAASGVPKATPGGVQAAGDVPSASQAPAVPASAAGKTAGGH